VIGIRAFMVVSMVRTERGSDTPPGACCRLGYFPRGVLGALVRLVAGGAAAGRGVFSLSVA
jgi:hypothetical protein